MDLCTINPKGTWEWMFENPTVMLLTHLVERFPEYKEMALKSNVYKILDNSLIELGGALSMERLVNAAEAIQADEIILPDVFQDGAATVEEAKKSINWLKEHNMLGKYKLMVVCHGKTFEEWEDCFNKVNAMPEVDVIGVPKVTATWLPNHNRDDLYPIFKNTNKQVHLLGSWYSLSELLTLRKECWDFVRSADTCLPALCAIQNITVWDDRDGTIELDREYEELTREKYDVILDQFERCVIFKYIGMEA